MASGEPHSDAGSTRSGPALVVIGGSCAMLLLGVMLLRPGPEDQAERCFAALASAWQALDARALIATTDPSYDFVEHWQELQHLASPARQAAAQGQVDELTAARDLVRSELARAFLWLGRQGSPPALAFTIATVADLGDGRVEALVSIDMDGQVTGLGRRIAPASGPHRFILQRQGWLRPQLRILTHDPIPIRG